MNKYNEILDDIYKASQYGIQGITDIIGKVDNPKFKTLLNEIKGDYQDISEVISRYFEKTNFISSEVGPIIRIQMWIVTEMKTLLSEDLSNLASLVIEGEKKGIEQVIKIIKENELPDNIRKITDKFLNMQKSHIDKLKMFL